MKQKTILLLIAMLLSISAVAQTAVQNFNKGVEYYNAGNYTEAAKWYRKAAEQGLAEAQFNLGVCYKKGEGVPQSYSEAVKWYRKAAEQGLAEAQYNLGVCYKKGEGVPQSYSEAVKWYRKAAEQGLAEAQFNLGLCYENGDGVTQSDAEAMNWYRKAAEQGLADAQFFLGLCYENGDGVTQSDAEAMKWYRKAANQGNPFAQSFLDRLQQITSGKEVDLGLPSGTIWAGWNLGATSPEQNGDYYAWGETTTKNNYSENTYRYYNNSTKRYINIGSNISGTQYDVARQKWGGSWRMPTKADFDELLQKCKWTWCQYKGVNGCKVTGPNGNSIFLPAAEARGGSGNCGKYWSASLNSGYSCSRAFGLEFYQNNYHIFSDYFFSRGFGLKVRPVK